MQALNRLLDFIELLHKFQNVERKIRIKGRDYPENDAEHSYQLAMTAWYLISSEKLPLDAITALKYALTHDLVETYAGDVDFYDHEARVGKKEREKEARDRILAEFPEAEEIVSWIDKYEEKADEESNFIYALDKILPIINIYRDGGRAWKERGVTLESLIRDKTPKVGLSPAVKRYFDLIVTILKEREYDLFPPTPIV